MNDLADLADLRRPFPIDARDLHARLGVGRDFTTWIKERLARLLFRRGKDLLPYQDFIEAGYFAVRESPYTTKDGREHLFSQTMVTGKGEVWLAKRFPEAVHA